MDGVPARKKELGRTADDIIQDYPGLTAEDIQAALSYAAELAHERTVYIAPA